VVRKVINMSLDLNYSANVLVSTDGMPEDEWLNWRRKGIGGSDAGAVLGISPYKTARDIYFEKIGREPDYVSDTGWVALEVGKRLEDLVAQIFAKKTGFNIWQEKKMFQHPLYPFMLADMDYFFETPAGEIGILECKTANIYAKENWENDSVPYHYEMQCRHYMAVKNISKVYIACLFSNSEADFIYRLIERDLDIEEAMIEEEAYFWEEYVENGIEPSISSDGDLALASLKRYGDEQKTGKDDMIMFAEHHSVELEQIVRLRAEKAALEKNARDLEKSIRTIYSKFAHMMGNVTKGKCFAADGSEYVVTYNPSVRTSVNRENLERMRLNDRAMYDKYVTETECRAFQVKKYKS